MTNKIEYDGRHLMIDALTDSSSILAIPEKAIAFLEDVVEKINMTMILPPVTVKFPHSVCELNKVLDSLKTEGLEKSKTATDIKANLKNRKEQTYGYSTFLMIAESHISIHTFPELKYISFDCYSCKYFDTSLVEKLLVKHFRITKLNSQSVKRLIP